MTDDQKLIEECKIPLTKEEFALVSPEDYDRVAKFKWHTKVYPDGRKYAARSIKGKPTTIRLHRFILNPPKGKVVDHINHNCLDNRRENLRIATRSENNANRFKSKGKFSSKYLGVTYYPYRSYQNKKMWMASISHKDKSITIGYFETEVEAAKARDKKAKELFGKFTQVNFNE